MKTTLLLSILLMLSVSVQAQSNDSLVVLFWQSPSGVRPAIAGAGYDGNRFDSDGDGIAEIVSVEPDENGVPIKMYITSMHGDSVKYVVDLEELRTQIFTDGFESGDVAALRFVGFLHWRPYDGSSPVDPILFSANDGLVVHDPLGFNIGMPPSLYKFFSVTDFDDDGWPEIVVANKEEKRVQVFGSKLAPANQ